GVPASFFVLGANVATGRNDALLARMVREGHTLGIHGHSHRARPLFRERLVAGEIRAALDAVHGALRRAGVPDPPRVVFFRPPAGSAWRRSPSCSALPPRRASPSTAAPSVAVGMRTR